MIVGDPVDSSGYTVAESKQFTDLIRDRVKALIEE
jgi:hypothetical protein